MNLNEITDAVRSQFRETPPNGWLLDWNESRHIELIRSASAPLPTTNHTTFDYGFCNWYEVNVDGEGGVHHWTLTIKLSFVVPAFCIYWTQYGTPTDGSVIEAAPLGCQQVEDRVRAAIEDAGFFELPREWHEERIDGVELELSGQGDVTLDKCLFQDHPG